MNLTRRPLRGLGILILSATCASAVEAAGGLTTAAVPPGPDPTRVSIEAEYSQSPGVWTTATALDEAEGRLSAVNRLLDRSFGTFEASTAVFRAKLSGLRVGMPGGLTEFLDLTLSAEALTVGRVDNPVVPALTAVTAGAGVLEAELRGRIPEWRLETGLRVIGGMGPERRVNAVSTDLIDSLPVRSGVLFFGGTGARAGRLWRLGERVRFRGALDGEALYFGGTTPQTEAFWNLRWQALAALTFSSHANSDFGFHFLAGPNPLPERTLPRLYDLARPALLDADAGTMLGAGIRIGAYRSGTSDLEADLGFYGGYVGARLEYRYRDVSFRLGTWGLEGSYAFQTLGQRFYDGTVRYRF